MEDKKMKKYFFAFAALVMAAVSCTKEQDIQQTAPEQISGSKVALSLSVSSTPTKTYVSDPATGAITWEAGDAIGVFTDLDTSAPIEFTMAGAPGATATFEGSVTQGATKLYAFYPYDAGATFADGKITTTLPSVQEFGANNTVKGAMVALGTGAKNLDGTWNVTLKNAFAYLKFKIATEDVKEIVLNAGSGKIAGTATFSAADASMTGTGTTATIRATREGYFTKDSWYYIPVLPGTVDALELSMDSNTHGADTGTPGFEDWKAARTAASAITFTQNQGKEFPSLDADGTTNKWTWYFDIHDAASLERFRALVAAGKFPAAGVAKFTDSFSVSGDDVAAADGVFSGTLHGNNNTLTWTANGKSLIKVLDGEVSGLNIAGTVTPEVNGMFGTVADSVTVGGVIDGCKNYADGVVSKSSINAWTRVGMIAGKSNGLIQNCENHGDLQITVTGNASNSVATEGGTWIGGIAGQFDASGLVDKISIKSCINDGSVSLEIDGTSSNNYMFVGGITGGTMAHTVASATSEIGSIDGCYNYKDVSLTLKNGGSLTDDAGVEGSANYSNVGGIAGYVEGSITNCYNGTAENNADAEVSSLFPTKENGACVSRPAIGGIAGFVLRNVAGCYNYGKVSIKGTFAGGGTGNPGNGVSHEVDFGGIVGQAGPASDADSYSISNCHNYGALDFKGWMAYGNGTGFNYGGVAGYSSVALVNCTNNSSMSVESKGAYNRIGGIVGNTTSSLSALTNNSTLTLNLKRTTAGEVATYKQLMQELFVGGVVGKISNGKAMSTLINNGDITLSVNSADALAFSSASKHLSIGGVAGYLSGAANLSGLSNTGSIVLNSNQTLTKNVNLGGVVGLFESTTSSLTDFSNSGNLTNNISTSGAVNVAGITTQIQAATFSGTTYNSGDITNNGSSTASSGEMMHIAGLIGIVQGTKLNGTAGSYITNSGNITNTGSAFWQTIGGVVSHCNSSADASITYCKNTGKVSTTGGNTNTDASNLAIAGVIARTNQPITFNNLINGDESAKNDAVKGVVEINASAAIGCRMLIAGCVAYTACSYSATVTGMRNYGTVTIKGDAAKYTRATYNYVGGIYATDNSGSGVTMSGAQNYGNITIVPKLQLQVGGITAYTGGAGSMLNNYCECAITTGDTKSNTYIGGIMGYSAKGTYTGNTFKGSITVGNGTNENVGGIIGASGAVAPNVNGQKIKAVLSVGSGGHVGLVSGGNNQSSTSYSYTVGSEANHSTIYTGSSVNGTAITSSNYKTYLVGDGGKTTVNADYTDFSEAEL